MEKQFKKIRSNLVPLNITTLSPAARNVIALHSIILSTLAFSSSTMLGNYLVITQPGVYRFNTHLSYAAATTNESIICINSNNVTLDLGGWTLSQNNLVDEFKGIEVNPNLSNITIRNGAISNITGTGIVINQGCSHILIENIITNSCDRAALNVQGTSQNTVTDVIIRDCRIENCCKASLGTKAFAGSFVSRSKIAQCSFIGNGNTNHNLSTIRLDNVDHLTFNDIEINKSTAGDLLIGFECTKVQYSTFDKCTIANSSATNASSKTVGFAFIAGADSSSGNTGNRFSDCHVLANAPSASNSSAIGFELLSNNNDNIFKECLVQLNSSTGPLTSYLLSSNSNNIFLDCIALSNSSSAATAEGFKLTSCTACKIIRSLTSNHSGTVVNGYLIETCTDCECIDAIASSQSGSTTGYGFQMTGCTTCVFHGCAASRNRGANSNSSYGFKINSDTGSIFVKNTATKNGSSAGNQFHGLAANNANNVASSNTNGSPWTNFGITN